jgi:hypothetical protein
MALPRLPPARRTGSVPIAGLCLRPLSSRQQLSFQDFGIYCTAITALVISSEMSPCNTIMGPGVLRYLGREEGFQSNCVVVLLIVGAVYKCYTPAPVGL